MDLKPGPSESSPNNKMGLKSVTLFSLLATLLLCRENLGQSLPVFVVLFLVLQLILLADNLFFYPHYRSPLRSLPGPNDGHILLGQTLKFIRAESANDLPLNFMRRFLDAPLIRYMHIGGSEWILVNSIQAVREIYQSKCYDFIKPSYFRRITGEIVGIGLVNAEGDIHRQERRLINANIKKLVPVFNDKAEAFSSSLGQFLAGSPDEVINVCDLFQRSTLSVISLATLGIELESLSTARLPFSELYRRIQDQDPAGITLSLINTFIPIRWIPLEANRKFLEATKEVRQVLRKTIQSRLIEVQSLINGHQPKGTTRQFTEKGSQDLLTFMLYEKGIGENRWTEDEILGHVLNFMSAGHDTTATALTWAVMTLCLRPHIQSRLREEILTLLSHNEPPSYTELDTMPYLAAFTKEVLRCFSPTTLNARTPIKDTMICDTVLPAGTTVLITPQVLNFSPKIWGPDAETFDPARHLPDDKRGKDFPLSRDPFAMASFGYGPRICIGKTFALLQMKSMLVEILRKFELERGWDKDGKKLSANEVFTKEVGFEENDVFGGVKVKNFLVLKPKGGVWVRFMPRSS